MGFFDKDADIEQAWFEAEGSRIAELRGRGVCSHGWTQGYTAEYRPDLVGGKVECLDCHTVFESEVALEDARLDVLS